MKRRLPVLDVRPPPPTPGEVLYVAPTPDRAGRKCGNCALWTPPTCSIHAASVLATSIHTCGYHIFGERLPSRDAIRVKQFVTPETSGLIIGPMHGTNCGTCAFFDAPDSLCYGVASEFHANGWSPTPVDADGCCARWLAR